MADEPTPPAPPPSPPAPEGTGDPPSPPGDAPPAPTDSPPVEAPPGDVPANEPQQEASAQQPYFNPQGPIPPAYAPPLEFTGEHPWTIGLPNPGPMDARAVLPAVAYPPPRRSDTEAVMEGLTQSVQQFASAMVEAEKLKLQIAAKESETEIALAKQEVELAKIQDDQHARAEQTNRVVMPLATVGAFAVLLYALKLGVLAQSATALATIGIVFQYLRREAAELKKKTDKDKPDK